jgi:DNA-binding Lrp family transcriptional regulator
MLRADARIANKEMAIALNVAESTIAARIKGLSDRGVMRIVALRDIRALGFDLLAHIDIFVSGRATEDVANELTAMEDVAMVATFPSSPQIIIQVNAASRKELSAFITERLAGVGGIRSIQSSTYLEILKYNSEFGVLGPQ